jgi:hypothetical protein
MLNRVLDPNQEGLDGMDGIDLNEARLARRLSRFALQ